MAWHTPKRLLHIMTSMKGPAFKDLEARGKATFRVRKPFSTFMYSIICVYSLLCNKSIDISMVGKNNDITVINQLNSII